MRVVAHALALSNSISPRRQPHASKQTRGRPAGPAVAAAESFLARASLCPPASALRARSGARASSRQCRGFNRGCVSVRCSAGGAPEEWDTLLADARVAAITSPEKLLEIVQKRRGDITTGFIFWVGDKAIDAEKRGDADEGAALDSLCGRLVALCDRVDTMPSVSALSISTTAASLAAAASSPAATDARDQEEGDAGGGPDGGLGGALVSQTSTSSAPASLAGLLGARWAALAVQGEEKADTLEDEEDEVRQKAVTEIIGRAQLSAEEVGALMQPSAEARAERILAVLLAEPRRAARLEMLGEALTPADEAAAAAVAEAGDEGDELLETTAPRLLQQLELAIKRMAGEGEEAVAGRFAALLPGEAPIFHGAPGGVAEVLLELRAALIARIDEENGAGDDDDDGPGSAEYLSEVA